MKQLISGNTLKQQTALLLWGLLGLVFFTSGCDEANILEEEPPLDDLSTWEVINTRILTPNCATVCHVSGTSFAEQSDLILTQDVAYEQLVDAPVRNNGAQKDGLVRVSTEGLPGLFKSFLWEKINAPDQEHFYTDHPTYGAQMPLGADPLTNGELEYIRKWIVEGAPETGVVADVALLQDTTRYVNVPFEPLPIPANGIQYHLGPFDVAPESEREFMYYEPSISTEDVLVNRIEVMMRPGSHHFVFYMFDENIPRLPASQTYRDIRTDDGTPIIQNLQTMRYHIFWGGTQYPRFNYTFPPGIAVRVPGGRGLDLNSHYVNRSTEVRQGEVYGNLHFADPSEVEHVAEFLNLNNLSINLPPLQETTLTKSFTFDERRHIFQLMSHAHETMTEFRVEVIGGPRNGELVYVAYDWEHPPILEIDPPLTLEAGEGLKLIATYNNFKDRTLHFGLLSEDEMMILFGYYYTD